MADRRRREGWLLIALLLVAVGGGIWLLRKEDSFSYMTQKERQRIDEIDRRLEKLERERDGGQR